MTVYRFSVGGFFMDLWTDELSKGVAVEKAVERPLDKLFLGTYVTEWIEKRFLKNVFLAILSDILTQINFV